MVDRFKIVYEDIEKHGQRIMLESILLAIFKTSRGLYEDAKEEVLEKHQITIKKIEEKEYIDEEGKRYKPIMKSGKEIARDYDVPKHPKH